MIGLIVKNNLCRTTLLELLESLGVEVYQPDHTYDLLLTTDVCDSNDFSAPLVTLGISLKGALMHIDTPVRPDDLLRTVQLGLTRLQHRTTFENANFVFRSSDRSLLIKKSQELILLTEKENDLLSALAAAYPNPLDKETLLEQVWNYKPDTETHTLESHIYTLRQKIGPKADSLIQSTATGYVLITSRPD